ncbi:putative transcription factor and/or regulators TTF-type(Zn) family [Helianthus annuus]|uniref:Putative TTF-type zinc finger protein with HAT dimerization domain-containing protein n=1 Tax=Helianthus annuus TaxID=4232 RepID=A0A251THY1_HELAN|nr:putative transcription factor and/or regulators TTF-type(Zn) family [Helianthus annuus]
MPPKYKHLSGCQKRKRRKIEEEKRRSQEGAIRKFFQKEPQSSNVEKDEVNDNVNANVDKNDVDANMDEDDVDANVDKDDVDANVDEDEVDANVDEDEVDANVDEDDVDANVDEDDVDANVDANVNPNIDIFDPRNWDGLNHNMINDLVKKGPKRDLNMSKGPVDKHGRRFSTSMYTRILPNRETCDREWLVYSKELDKLFCFCCKIFRQGHPKGTLDGEGFSDWKHATRLKDHEVSVEHLKNMKQWFEMRQMLDCNTTIDKVAYEQFKKERDYWKKVILRIIQLVKFLAKHGLAFRGSNEKLFQKGNGNFLGLVEMLEEFDPIMKEHVRRIMNDETHIHYLGHNIQNELIVLLADKVKAEIIKKIKQAKYYSIILDCTPDTSHQEQMSIIVRYVNDTTIEESFLGFLIVDDTTGKGLFDVTVKELKSLGLDINDMRGQGYDNGANMKGKHSGVQKRFLIENPRALYVACGCHSLNLALCDMANTCTKSRDFFGIIQRFYTIFANSTKRWQILKDNVKGLTLKSLSATRWESPVDSVKPIRTQLVDVRKALLRVRFTDNDAKIQSEAKSLAEKELGEFDFLVATVIWYEILTTVNVVSKKLQSKDMVLDVAIDEVGKLIKHFKNYREVGFDKAINEAKEIANEMGVDTVFPQKRLIFRKQQFDETSTGQEVLFSPEEDFRVNYFLCIVDQAIASLETRFEQYQQYEKVFGFLFPKKLRELTEKDLKSRCYGLQDALKFKDESDVDADELYEELKLFETFLPSHIVCPFDAFNSLKKIGFFPNALIAYRVLLTIPVTVASAERSFSKLKLLKTYLRSSMSQERLNGLAMISIENDILETMDYEDLIESFASRNARRAARFA